MSEIALKRCSRCGAEKPYSEFIKCSKNKSGIGSWCKDNLWRERGYDK